MSEGDRSVFQGELGFPGWTPGHSRVRVLGVCLSDPLPLKNAYLPLRPGVCALYGPNGVGKTKALVGLNVALQGRAPTSEMHEPPSRGNYGVENFSELFVQLVRVPEVGVLDVANPHPLTEHLMPELRRSAQLMPWEFIGPDADDFVDRGSLLGEIGYDPGEQSLRELDDVQDPRHVVQLRLRYDPVEEYGDHRSLGLKRATAKEIAEAGYFALRSIEYEDGAFLRRRSSVLVCIDEQSASSALRDLISGTFQELGRLFAESTEHWVVADNYPDVFRDEDATCLPLPHIDNFAVTTEGFLHQQDRPGWAPLKYLDLGVSSGLVPMWLDTLWVGSEVEYQTGYSRGDASVRVMTDVHDLLRRLARADSLDSEGEPVGGEIQTSDSLPLGSEVAKVFEYANEFFETLLGRGISLRPEFGSVNDLVAGKPPQILARDQSSGGWADLEQMSATEQRWAKVAIFLAWHLRGAGLLDEEEREWTARTHAAHLDGSLVVLIDEPELGLPLAIQRRLSRGLVKISEALAIPVVVATHSSALLDDLAVSTYRCGRNENGQATLSEVRRTDRDALRMLGVPISEELHLYRAVLVVEGQHEAVILDEMFSDIIAANRIKLLPIRGTRQLRLLAASGELLFSYIDAPFVLLTDKTRGPVVEQARFAGHQAETLAAAKEAIEQVLQPQSDEEAVLRSLLMAAQDSGRADRIRAVHGLEKDDIIHYLPCDHFAPGSTWDELVRQHDERGENEPRDFKRWLELTKDVDFSDENLRSAVRQMDTIPTEWTQVIGQCADIASE